MIRSSIAAIPPEFQPAPNDLAVLILTDELGENTFNISFNVSDLPADIAAGIESARRYFINRIKQENLNA